MPAGALEPSADGLPEMTKEAIRAEARTARLRVTCLMLAPRLVGLLFALLVYRLGDTESYDAQVAFINGLSGVRWGYLYLTVVIFSLLTSWLNLAPIIYKAKFLSTSASELCANTYILKVNGPPNTHRWPYVVVEEDGPVGRYNRANRSLHQFVEWGAAVALTLPFAGSIFPLCTLALTATFTAGRMWHQCGYSTNEYGSHSGGFGIILLSTALLEMLVLFSALKIFGAL